MWTWANHLTPLLSKCGRLPNGDRSPCLAHLPEWSQRGNELQRNCPYTSQCEKPRRLSLCLCCIYCTTYFRGLDVASVFCMCCIWAGLNAKIANSARAPPCTLCSQAGMGFGWLMKASPGEERKDQWVTKWVSEKVADGERDLFSLSHEGFTVWSLVKHWFKVSDGNCWTRADVWEVIFNQPHDWYFSLLLFVSIKADEKCPLCSVVTPLTHRVGNSSHGPDPAEYSTSLSLLIEIWRAPKVNGF